jgi:hypothetical protein
LTKKEAFVKVQNQLLVWVLAVVLLTAAVFFPVYYSLMPHGNQDAFFGAASATLLVIILIAFTGLIIGASPVFSVPFTVAFFAIDIIITIVVLTTDIPSKNLFFISLLAALCCIPAFFIALVLDSIFCLSKTPEKLKEIKKELKTTKSTAIYLLAETVLIGAILGSKLIH